MTRLLTLQEKTLHTPWCRRFGHPTLWLAAIALLAAMAAAGWLWHEHRARMIATIVPYNHTEVGIDDFYVDGTWGGISDPLTGGGRSLCCVTIPKHWSPGLQMTVKWRKDGSEQWLTKTVAVPRYDGSADLQVHFMKGEQVKVFVLDLWPSAKAHPLNKELESKP